MNAGKVCPRCESQVDILLATTNQWKYHCTECDCRFNEDGVVLSTSKELKSLLRELSEFVGGASCAGNAKCRLPHCTDCNEDVEEAYDRLDALEERIAEVLKED